MRVRDKGHIAITRVNLSDGRLVGWLVRTSLEGKPLRRFFADQKYGGRKAAYQAAKRFVTQWGSRSEFHALLSRLKPRVNSRSAIPGVARYQGEPGRGPYWLAYWDENGRKVQKRFPVSVHGEDKARELALAMREKGVRTYAERLEEIRRRDAHVLPSLLSNTEEASQGHPSRGTCRDTPSTCSSGSRATKLIKPSRACSAREQ